MLFRELVYEETESTNKVVKRAIEDGEAEGLVVRAWRQTGAYGRRGSAWSSPEGGLYLSVLLRPEAPAGQMPTLPLVAGLAVREALASLVLSDQARRIKLKWPNDIVVAPSPEEDLLLASAGEASSCDAGKALRGEGLLGAFFERQVACRSLSGSSTAPGASFRKLVGISSELHRGGLCLGIGVNVEPPRQPSEVAGRNVPAYLADLGFGFVCDWRSGVNDVARAVLEHLGAAYERWLAEGFAPRVAEYDACSLLRGALVEIGDVAGGPLAGEVSGVDERGRLLLRRDDGVAAVSSGEAHVVLRS